MTIGNMIAALRKENNMTQEMLANALGVTNQAVSKWESEQSCPDIALLPAIADLFGVSLDYLFGRTDARTVDVASLPWENDDTVRIVVYQGHRYLSDYPEADEITVRLSDVAVENVECAVSLIVEGDVGRNATAGGSLSCDNVMGDVHADGSVSCDEVKGSVHAGGSANCDDVGGDVTAGGSVNCDNVTGNVNAGGSINCESIGGTVDGANVIDGVAGDGKRHIIEMNNGTTRIVITKSDLGEEE